MAQEVGLLLNLYFMTLFILWTINNFEVFLLSALHSEVVQECMMQHLVWRRFLIREHVHGYLLSFLFHDPGRGELWWVWVVSRRCCSTRTPPSWRTANWTGTSPRQPASSHESRMDNMLNNYHIARPN